MERIYQRDGIFWFANRPIAPAPYVFQPSEPVGLVIRLQRTRRGHSARYEYGQNVRPCLRGGSNPVLRAMVTEFSWSPANTPDCPSRLVQYNPDADEIIQAGSGVVNFRARVIGPLPDPVLDELQKAVQAGLSEPVATQGHLTVHNTAIDMLGLRNALIWGSGARWFYNHLIVNHKGFTYRVIGKMAYAIVLGNPAILSPDHPDEPIFVSGPVILRHRFPTRTRTID